VTSKKISRRNKETGEPEEESFAGFWPTRYPHTTPLRGTFVINLFPYLLSKSLKIFTAPN